MAKRIDHLNTKRYGALTVMLTVSDLEKAAHFYQKAFGFKSRGLMKIAGKPAHAELTLRDCTLMLTPKRKGWKIARASMASGISHTLFLYVHDVDKVISKATKLGARQLGKVEDMFWGDRRGHVTDEDGHDWMIATHVADYTRKQFVDSGFTFSPQTDRCFEPNTFPRDAGDPPPFIDRL